MSNFVVGVVVIATLLPSIALGQNVADVADPTEIPAEGFSTDPIARFSARLAYNTEGGAVAGVGYETDRLFGRDQTLRFSLEGREGETRADAYYANDAVFGSSPTFGLRLRYAEARAGDTYDFNSSALRIEPRLTWQLSPALTAAAYAAYSMNEIDNVPATTSVLIRADEGDQTTQTLGMDLEYDVPVVGGGFLHSARLTFGGEAGTTSRDNEFLRLTASAQAIHVMNDGNAVLRISLRFGALESQSGTSSIGNRFMLGSASVRGFEFGGFGPRDLAIAGTPALGGNYYGIGRFDMQFPNAIQGGESRLTPGVFVDMGSLWGLDDVAGGLVGADAVDDSSQLRGSIGLTMRIQTGIGPIQVYVANPFEQQDYDRTQTFGLSLSHSF